MNSLATNYFAETMAAERAADTKNRARLARLMTEAGVDHPVRRRFSMRLIEFGLRLSPERLELVRAPGPAADC
ncbi:MAG: hypothetical protein HKN91_13480 [Acidimicrobiia bacterium]|nr:hypothetical protein [Acidimicrobiia bacterium]